GRDAAPVMQQVGAPMTPESRRLAGALLVVLPTVMIGGISILTLLIRNPMYMANPLRQDLWRAGHAHAGVFLVLSLVTLRYVDDAELSVGLKMFLGGFFSFFRGVFSFSFFFF